MSDFIGMGGYGGYVWPAYIISAITLGVFAYLTIRRVSKARARLEALEARRARNSDD